MAQTEPNRAPKPSIKIGRYRVIRKLGKGAQGIVYLAEDPDIGREVAIKALTNQAADKTALLTEARNVDRLKHSHIATVFDIRSFGDTPYVVNELISGESLRAILLKGPVSAALAFKWVGQILTGIDYAHTEGIVHHDLNPNNFMVDADGNAKVLDFGIATLSGTVMAPGDELPLPSQVNEDVDKKFDIFVAHARAKEPRERYFSARAIREALEKCACDEDALTTPANDSETVSKKSTLAFLIRRMRRKSDFPAMSERITEINQQTTQRENASASELTNTILKDYALTTKLLKPVNSSSKSSAPG